MTDRRALALVLLLPVACWLACWPFVDMPVNDDFGYAFVVVKLLETGRLVYNGWIGPIVGAQAYWGAAFAWAFGFSHDVMRVSTLPLSLACALLAYALHRRLGVPPRWAAFATLVLVCSPLFTPWSASFMTDVPGLLFTLALYNAIVALARARTVRGIWIAATLLAVAAAVGGTIRQTNFIFGGVALALELARRRRALRTAAAVAVPLVALAWIASAVLAWYARQPYALVDVMPAINHVGRATVGMSGMLLTLTMFLFPLGVAWAGVAALGRRTLAIAGVACAICCPAALYVAVQRQGDPRFGEFFTQLGFSTLGLWSGNTLTPTGLLFDGLDAPGERPILFGWTSRSAIAVGVYWLLALIAIAAWRRRASLIAGVRAVLADRSSRSAQAIASMTAIVAVYAALLFPRAGLLVIFDRYLLVVMPVVSAGVLYAYRRRLSAGGPGRIAWAFVALYAFVGSAVTYDHFAELRARARIATAFESAGVPRTALANGLTFDAWTQLLDNGLINDEQVVNPPGAYRRDPHFERRLAQFWFLPRTPAVQPRWIVVNATEPPAALGSRRLFTFDALLPPRRRYLVAWPVRPPTDSPTTKGQR